MAKSKLEVDDIRCIKLDDSEYYLQEVLENIDFVAYLDKKAVKDRKIIISMTMLFMIVLQLKIDNYYNLRGEILGGKKCTKLK